MKKFIPYDKLSKKQKRAMDRSRRNTWGEISPVTRKPAASGAYNRAKARRWERDSSRFDPRAFPFLPFSFCRDMIQKTEEGALLWN